MITLQTYSAIFLEAINAASSLLGLPRDNIHPVVDFSYSCSDTVLHIQPLIALQSAFYFAKYLLIFRLYKLMNRRTLMIHINNVYNRREEKTKSIGRLFFLYYYTLFIMILSYFFHNLKGRMLSKLTSRHKIVVSFNKIKEKKTDDCDLILQIGLQIGTQNDHSKSKDEHAWNVKSTFTSFLSDRANFLKRILTQEETWVHHFDPEMNQINQNKQWKHAGSFPSTDLKRMPSVGFCILGLRGGAHDLTTIKSVKPLMGSIISQICVN